MVRTRIGVRKKTGVDKICGGPGRTAVEDKARKR